MDIEFVAATAALPPKTALARIVFEGAALEGAAAQAAAASRFTSRLTCRSGTPSSRDASNRVISPFRAFLKTTSRSRCS